MQTAKQILNPCITLALPNSGPYAAISAKIRQGASIAANELKKSGRSVRLEQIDTDNPSWLNMLANLPAECAVVGGPLRENAYVQARQSGILAKKVFFAFLPNLQANDEGKAAWRFFPSPEDQAQALVDYVTQDLNINTFGAFYPDDAYGRKMTAIFENVLKEKHLTLNAVPYNPKAPATWATDAKRLVNPVMAGNGKNPVPQTMFEALFLPESWKQIPGLTKAFIYNGEDRLLLLGPMMWSQAIGKGPVANAHEFALAIFPGVWRDSVVPEPLKNVNPDFWMGLGFDFLNFAANLGIDYMPEANDVAIRAMNASTSIRALAPITWSNTGKASQKMYLFQVGPTGIVPANREKILLSKTASAERMELRKQGNWEPAESKEEIRLPPQPEIAAPTPKPVLATPGSPALSTVPQPSYKLRLPGQK